MQSYHFPLLIYRRFFIFISRQFKNILLEVIYQPPEDLIIF